MMIFNIALMAAAFAAQTNVTPASAANVDAFMAVLPPSKGGHDELDPSEVETQDQLLKLNPGREAKVREIIAAHRQCLKPLERDAINYSLRKAAGMLGDDKLKLMTEFYRKGEQTALEPLLAKRKAGTLTAVEEAELKRLLDTYPLLDYREATNATLAELFNNDSVIDGLAYCDNQTEKSVAAAGLKQE